MAECVERIASCDRQFDLYSGIAPLAMADDVLPLIVAIERDVASCDVPAPDKVTVWAQDCSNRLTELLHKWQDAGRKDLWGGYETAAKGAKP